MMRGVEEGDDRATIASKGRREADNLRPEKNNNECEEREGQVQKVTHLWYDISRKCCVRLFDLLSAQSPLPNLPALGPISAHISKSLTMRMRMRMR